MVPLLAFLLAKTLQENIDSYIKACESVGIPSHYNFMTVDLYEGKNLEQVCHTVQLIKHDTM